jgi:uncharacterized protein YabN with tetrapyrrole methylase and pyrophosphatase domain
MRIQDAGGRRGVTPTALILLWKSAWCGSAALATFADVVDPITAKMTRWHPHVFEDTSLRDGFLASGTCERVKAEEKAPRAKIDEGSLLDDVPLALARSRAR